MSSNGLLWFRNDLRLTDNPALDFLVRGGQTIIPLYIYEDEDQDP